VIAVTPEEIKAYYRNRRIKILLIIIVAASLLALSFVVSMGTGYSKMSVADLWKTISGNGTKQQHLILFELRLPRIVVSMLIGVGLAVSGCILQSVTRNPLAEPGLLGINAGAGLMVVLYVILWNGKSLFAAFSLPFFAMIGSGLAAALVYLLAYRKTEGVLTVRLVLVGVAVQVGISSVVTLITVIVDKTYFDFVASWLSGSIWGITWRFVLVLLPWLAILIPYVIRRARVLDILKLGDEAAVGLGAQVEKERRRLLAVAVVLAAVCVSVSGNINFVGLIAPQVALRLVGGNHRVMIPVAALVGGTLMSISDSVARVIVLPNVMPTGIVMAVIGAPYFLYLLARADRK
jgi:iron complex transport system permease protein